MRRSTMAIAVLVLAGGALPAEARQCATMGATELVASVRYCVDSVLGSQSGNNYGPQNLFDGDPGTAWCEGAGGAGAGQRIVLTVTDGAPFDRLLIWNGYQKNAASFTRNARPRTILVSADGGAGVQYNLPDARGEIVVGLMQMAERRRVTITVKTVYPGTRYADMCISGLYLDFESGRDRPQRPEPEPQPPFGGGAPTTGGLQDIAPLPELPGL